MRVSTISFLNYIGYKIIMSIKFNGTCIYFCATLPAKLVEIPLFLCSSKQHCDNIIYCVSGNNCIGMTVARVTNFLGMTPQDCSCNHVLIK